MKFTLSTLMKLNFSGIRKCSYATRKRFYLRTGVLHSGNGSYEVTLDQRKLKTPKGNLFVVKSEPLALAVAEEWDSQKDKILQTSMHLTTLCNTAIDNPNNLTKYDVAPYLINFLDTDTILFQSNEDDDLFKLQVKEWDPIIQWFCDRFQVDLAKSRQMQSPKEDLQAKAIINKYLLSYSFEALHGFLYAVDTLKSLILTVACVERRISVEKAVLLSRLEEEYQSGRWGRVEWAHDLNQQDLQARLAATLLFVYFHTTSTFSRSKAEIS